MNSDKVNKNYDIHLALEGTTKTRDIYLPNGLDFGQLHSIIQLLFGWEDYHMHEFVVNAKHIVADEWEDAPETYGRNCAFESDVNLDLVLSNMEQIEYCYDFGDDWKVKISVKGIIGNNGKLYNTPYLYASKGNMAIEDCGGADGLKGVKTERVNKQGINMILEEMFDF